MAWWLEQIEAADVPLPYNLEIKLASLHLVRYFRIYFQD